MTNKDKYLHLLDIAKRSAGYVPDPNVYVPLRGDYVPAMSAVWYILQDPAFKKALFGCEKVETGRYDKDLNPIAFPAWQHYGFMATMARDEGLDVIDYYYQIVTNKENL